MPVPRLATVATPPTIDSTPGRVKDAIALQGFLGDRDRELITLLARHQVLTTEQITRIGFDNPITARHRLTLLCQRGALARFRRLQRPGSQSWRYTLGVNGALMHAATEGYSLPKPSTVAEKILKLAQSPKLDHLIGINEFFVSLIETAKKNQGCELSEWWPENQATRSCGDRARPDGYGEWTENGRTVGFFLEYDNGTEALTMVRRKLEGYRRLAHGGISKPVLFVFPSTARELNFQQMLNVKSRFYTEGVAVATCALDHLATTQASPADAVWMSFGHPGRRRLIDFEHLADRPLPRRNPTTPALLTEEDDDDTWTQL